MWSDSMKWNWMFESFSKLLTIWLCSSRMLSLYGTEIAKIKQRILRILKLTHLSRRRMLPNYHAHERKFEFGLLHFRIYPLSTHSKSHNLIRDNWKMIPWVQDRNDGLWNSEKDRNSRAVIALEQSKLFRKTFSECNINRRGFRSYKYSEVHSINSKRFVSTGSLSSLTNNKNLPKNYES